MITTNKNVGDAVSFRLDGNWYGTGNIVTISSDKSRLIVKLDEPCKEFEIGDQIVVDASELV